MSVNSNKKINGVPKFNGDTDKFPMFCIKFEGLIFRLGTKCTKALHRRKPYNDFTYGQEYTRNQFQTRDVANPAQKNGSSSSTSSSRNESSSSRNGSLSSSGTDIIGDPFLNFFPL